MTKNNAVRQRRTMRLLVTHHKGNRG